MLLPSFHKSEANNICHLPSLLPGVTLVTLTTPRAEAGCSLMGCVRKRLSYIEQKKQSRIIWNSFTVN